MSADRTPDRPVPTDPGDPTPETVDVAQDRRDRSLWAVLVAGPLIGIVHFMAVYLVAEAGCTGGGDGLELFDPPVPTVVTLGATLLAVVACMVAARVAFRRWRIGVDEERLHAEPLSFAGFLLSLLFLVTVLLVGATGLFLGC